MIVVYCFAYNNDRHANMQPPRPPNLKEFALKAWKQTTKAINHSMCSNSIDFMEENSEAVEECGLKKRDEVLFFFLFNRLDASGWVPKYDSCFPISNAVACSGELFAFGHVKVWFVFLQAFDSPVCQ